MASAASARPWLRSWPSTLASRLNYSSNGTIERLDRDVNGQCIPRGKPWDRQRISGKRRRKFVSVPGLRRISTIQPVALASYYHSSIRGRDDARLVTGPSLRAAHASQQRRGDAGDGGFPGHRNRRQFGDFQRGGCAAAASPALSAARPSGRRVAAFSRYRNFPRLAVAGPVYRYPERESFLRADGPRQEPERHLDRPGAT